MSQTLLYPKDGDGEGAPVVRLADPADLPVEVEGEGTLRSNSASSKDAPPRNSQSTALIPSLIDAQADTL